MKIKRMPFGTWKVKRIWAGASQTRRLMKPQPPEGVSIWKDDRGRFRLRDEFVTPRYKVGEIVAMGEALVKGGASKSQPWPEHIAYAVDEHTVIPLCAWSWKPKKLAARYMPLWAARRWHRIADVRAERMLDISEEDALAEGLVHDLATDRSRVGAMSTGWLASDGAWYSTHTAAWVATIRDHNPKMGPDENPWLWAYTLEQVERPT